MKRLDAKIVSNKLISKDIAEMILHVPQISAEIKAGQFVEIDTNGATLLKKPISIADLDPIQKNMTLYYKVIGKGTQALANFPAGSSADIIGALGNGFPLPQEACYIVGGGIGIPPMYLLAKNSKMPIDVFLGARSKDDLILIENFRNINNVKNVTCTTDDGSFGQKGFVISALMKAMQTEKRTVYACGPFPLLKAIAKYCAEENVDCFVCMEAYMGCGVGACMGCVIPTKNGMQRVCKEGPVFSANDIFWDEF